MREKYFMGKFGVCPRVMCERQAVLPIGMSEELRTSRVKVETLKNLLSLNYIVFSNLIFIKILKIIKKKKKKVKKYNYLGLLSKMRRFIYS